MKSLPKDIIKVDTVINFVLSRIEKDNGKIFFYNQKYFIKDNKKIIAFFKQPHTKKENPEIHICIKEETTNNLLLILLHEFSHYLQWKNNLPSWKRYIKNPSDITAVFELEAECEDYTRLIIEKEFNHLFDKIRFTKETNSYLSYYLFFLLTQKWFLKHPKFSRTILKEVSGTKIIRSLSDIVITDKMFNSFFKLIRG